MIGCFLNPESCIPEWVTFIFRYWDWLLASFILGLCIGAMAGWKGLLVGLTGGLALFWLRRGRGSEPDYEDGGDKPFRKPKPRTGDRRYRPEIGHGTWQRKNPTTGGWENE